MSKAKLALSFRIFQNGQFLREETLALGVIKIGKVPSAHLRIDDDSVSRMHAVLEVNQSDVHLIDLGSTRGTFVNGKKINKAKLVTGDVIQLGDVRVELAIADATAAAQPVARMASPAAPATTSAQPVARMASPAALATTSGTIGAAQAQAAPALALHSVLVSDPALVPPPTPAAPPPVPVLRSVPSSTPPPPIARPHAMASIAAAVTVPRPFGLPLDTAPHPAAVQRALAEAADDAGGARAIEVAAMLGDSVINVKHCVDPRGGAIRPATWGLFAASIASLLIAAVAFVVSVRTSADNEARRDTWTRVQHRPAAAFRPHLLGFGVDWLAFGGFALGVAGVGLTLWRMRGERTSPYYRIGTAPGVELAVEQAPLPAFPLIAPSGDDFVFNYGAGIDGEMIVDGKSTPLAELAAMGRARPSASTAGAIEVPIPARARIRARAGQATFMVSAVARPRHAATPILAHLESRVLSYVAGSLAIHLGIWALLQAIPPDQETASINQNADELLAMHVVGIQPTDPVPEQPVDHGDSGGSGDSAPAAAMKLESGEAGNPNAAHADGHLRIAQRDDRPMMTREEQIMMARTAGPLGSSLLLDSIRVLGATSDYLNGPDAFDSNGSLYGGEGEGLGHFGGGVAGGGPGGGCLGGPCGTIGLPGGYGKIGLGPRGTSYGIGDVGGPHGRPRNPGVPTLGPAVIASSNYDKSIVRRYIRRHLNEITYCYEKQLLAHPALGGDVTAQFFISPSGVVQSSTAAGFDTEVTSCLAGVIKSIEFPPPGEGGGVQVNYPFHFHAPSV